MQLKFDSHEHLCMRVCSNKIMEPDIPQSLRLQGILIGNEDS